MQEALLLMRKHLIVKYGQSDLQYTSPHHVINKYSLKAQKKKHAFLQIMHTNVVFSKQR